MLTERAGLESAVLAPNPHGDWLNQRRDDFDVFLPIGEKDGGTSVFTVFSGGLKSNRDAWVYNSNSDAVEANVRRMIDTYEAERFKMRTNQAHQLVADPTLVAWSGGLTAALSRGQRLTYDSAVLHSVVYRPFERAIAYFDPVLNERRYRLPMLFPTRGHTNVGFYALNPGAEKPFSVLMVDQIPDLALYGSNAGQLFARWRYEAVTEHESALFVAESRGDVSDGYRRIDDITDAALARFRAAYADAITKDDIFFYVYGLLHSPDYREAYAADLKKMLPRIPLVENMDPFVDAGRALSSLHLGYEAITPYPLDGLDVKTPAGPAAFDFFRVEKMRFRKPTTEQKTAGQRADRSTIVYNDRITLSGIPEAAYRYMLGSRSAIEWIMDRYQVKTKPSGIVNDPNDWSREVEDPRYIIDLVTRIVTVSLETMQIVDDLPPLAIRADQNPTAG